NPKIFEQDVLAVQENLQTANMSNRSQGAAEQHPIKSRKSSSDAAVVPLQKTLHDSPPAFCLFAQTYIARNVSHGAFFIWLRLCCAASSVVNSVTDSSPSASIPFSHPTQTSNSCSPPP